MPSRLVVTNQRRVNAPWLGLGDRLSYVNKDLIMQRQGLRKLSILFPVLCVLAGQSLATADDSPTQATHIFKTIGTRELKAEVHFPADWTAGDRRPAMVFFAGGAWRTGGTGQFRPQADYFAKRGLVTVRAEYRGRNNDKVNPDTCLKDAVTAIRWVRKNAETLGVDPDRVIGSGGSAGGYLAAAVATIKDFHSEDDDLSVSPVPNALVLFNPVLDFVSLDRAREFKIVGELAHRISPLQHVTKDVPPTLILIGTKDNFLGQNRQFQSKATALGVRVEIDLAEGQPHAYFNRSPWLERTIDSADKFLMSLGYLKEAPRVELPKTPPESE